MRLPWQLTVDWKALVLNPVPCTTFRQPLTLGCHKNTKKKISYQEKKRLHDCVPLEATTKKKFLSYSI